MSFERQELAQSAAGLLAAQGVYIGISSWKYRGWRGMLYNASRYEYRGKFAETRFKLRVSCGPISLDCLE